MSSRSSSRAPASCLCQLPSRPAALPPTAATPSPRPLALPAVASPAGCRRPRPAPQLWKAARPGTATVVPALAQPASRAPPRPACCHKTRRLLPALHRYYPAAGLLARRTCRPLPNRARAPSPASRHLPQACPDAPRLWPP
eukprot:4813951-Pleurochrysis_carterae.AAC.1